MTTQTQNKMIRDKIEEIIARLRRKILYEKEEELGSKEELEAYQQGAEDYLTVFENEILDWIDKNI